MIKEEDEEEVATKNSGGSSTDNGCDHNHPRIQPDGLNGSTEEIETLGSLERDLPVELSFLIRQQAVCLAKMNYLDRQIRELKESTSKQQQQQQVTQSNSINHIATTSRSNPQNLNQSNQLQQQQQQPQQHLYHHHNQQNLYNHLYLNHQRFNHLSTNINNFNPNAPNQNIPIQAPQLHHQNFFSTPIITNNPNHNNMTTATVANATTTSAVSTINKNGNFIPSDDSGGEYSRATISDDDELSSLLDQIAKSVKPPIIENNPIINQQHLHQQHMQIPIQAPHLPIQRSPYNVITTTNHHQPYAIINPNQYHQSHHQAVPVFVMGSPITTTSTPTHHPSSISSAILPGVHFQPEPRYNNYYADDFYVQQQLQSNQHPPGSIINTSNTTAAAMAAARYHPSISNSVIGGVGAAATGTVSSSVTNSCLNGRSRQQFDTSLSTIEQIVNQKEKRQVKSQLKSADNWLKMRASGLYSNLNNEFNIPSTSSMSGSGGTLVSSNAIQTSDNGQQAAMAAGPATAYTSGGTNINGSVVDKNSRASTVVDNNNSNSNISVIDHNQHNNNRHQQEQQVTTNRSR